MNEARTLVAAGAEFFGVVHEHDAKEDEMRIEHEIDIKRAPADVFAFLTDPEKLSAWQPRTVAVRRQRQGPLIVGERFEEVHKALGRELLSTVEVAAYDAPRVFALRVVAGALPLDGRWQLAQRPTGTRLHFIGQGNVRGLMRLTKPMLARQFRGYHQRLKDILERGANENEKNARPVIDSSASR